MYYKQLTIIEKIKTKFVSSYIYTFYRSNETWKAEIKVVNGKRVLIKQWKVNKK